MRETEVLIELKHSLSEWGVDLTSQEHRALRKQFAKDVLAILNERVEQTDTDDFQHLIPQAFPTTNEQAYQYVLEHDDVGNGPLFICHDSIATGFAPFYRRRDSRINPNTFHYVRRDEFQRFPKHELDPSNRFSFERVTKAELFFYRWFVESKASRLGVFMEAAIACYAIHNEACFHCKCRHVLRWKGGSSDAWQDLVCVKCQAIYEVKTKETAEKVQKAIHFNNIPGGSFRAACRLEKSRSPKKKRFLVLLARTATGKPGQRTQMVHKVQVEEISNILPALCESSFNRGRSSVAIRSVVSVKKRFQSLGLHSTGHWFYLPKAVCDRPLQEIARQVFLERFSEDEYERLSSKYFKIPALSIPQTENNSGDAPPKDDLDDKPTIESIIKGLAELDTAGWDSDESPH